MTGVFISHTHGDRAISDALGEMIGALFGDKLPVNSSTRKELDGGIAPGDDWFQWIVRQVVDADLAFILLTPTSVQKPWVLWEAGAVAGAAFATAEGDAVRRVYPLTFALKTADVPSPFARTQLVDGTRLDDVTKLIQDLWVRFGDRFTPPEHVQFGVRRDATVRTYLERVSHVLFKLPLMVTEASVQEWLSRLENLERERRYSEVPVFERWLDVTFGRDQDDRRRPLDLRIHRQLGKLYDNAKRPADAARQFELARQLAPRDIFLLHALGKAYVDQQDYTKAQKIISEIEEYDAAAFSSNPQIVGLKTRWHEEQNDLRGACDVLDACFRNCPWSYYIGDRFGQVLLKLGDFEKARDVYKQVLRELDRLSETNVWTNATTLTAAIVLQDQARIESSLRDIRVCNPTKGELASIERGARTVIDAVGGDVSIVGKLRGPESGG